MEARQANRQMRIAEGEDIARFVASESLAKREHSMRTRGRHSAASRLITPRGPAAERLEPPDYFNAAELAEWHAIVDRLDADFFPRESRVLVVSYISVSVALDQVNRKLSMFESGCRRLKICEKPIMNFSDCARCWSCRSDHCQLSCGSPLRRGIRETKRRRKPDVRPAGRSPGRKISQIL